jgi:hypothetical protein
VPGRGTRLRAEPGHTVLPKPGDPTAFETGVLSLTYAKRDPWQFQTRPGGGPDITHDGTRAGCPVTKDHPVPACL